MNFAAFKDLTRLEQTLFALPMVLSGALLSLNGQFDFQMRWLWIFPAFLAARISGMSFNQLIDRHIDAKNPRTQNRAIPSGRVSSMQARLIAWGTLIVFLLSCAQINRYCQLLSPLVAFLIYIYSYMKRIHASCHFVVGLIHFMGPIMAGLAISEKFSMAHLFLGFAALFSIAGNDIVYAIQDEEFDRKEGLFSLPSRFGVKKCLFFTRGLHILCVISLALVGVYAHLATVYYGIVGVAGIAFFLFHSKVAQHYQKTGSMKGIEPLFFFAVVIVSCSTLMFVLAGVLWDAML